MKKKKDSELTFLEYLEETFKFSPVESPVAEVKGTAMVLLTAGGRSFLGSVASNNDGLLEVFFPVVYAEIPDMNSQRQIIGVKPQMGKEWHTLSLPRWKLFNADSIYFLDSDNPGDKMLALEYDKGITAIKAAEAGVILAGPDQVPGGNVTPLTQV